MTFDSIISSLRNVFAKPTPAPVQASSYRPPVYSGKDAERFFKPTSTPTPTPTPVANPTPTLIPGAPQNPYMSLLTKYFPPEEVNNASNVSFKESSFNPGTIHPNNDSRGTKDYGLFQVNDYWQRNNLAKKGYTIEDMLDPEKAIEFASWLQSQNGWSPWVASKVLGISE